MFHALPFNFEPYHNMIRIYDDSFVVHEFSHWQGFGYLSVGNWIGADIFDFIDVLTPQLT